MVLVFTLLSKHGDQNPEAKAVSAGGLMFSFCPGTDLPTGCCPQNSFERQFLRILVINRKLVHRQSCSFSNSQVLFQFLWTCASTTQLCTGNKRDLVQKPREDLKRTKNIYFKKKKKCVCVYVKIQALLKLQNYPKHVMWEFPHMATWTGPQIFFLVTGETFPELLYLWPSSLYSSLTVLE